MHQPNVTVWFMLVATGVCLTSAAVAQVDSTWQGEAGNWSDAGMWSTTSYPDNNGTLYDVRIDGGRGTVVSHVSLDRNVNVSSLTIDTNDPGQAGPDQLTQLNARDLTIDGDGVMNNGLWLLSSTGSTTRAVFDGSQDIDGSGELVLGDNSANQVKAAGSDQVLTNRAGHTIRGSGTLMNNVGNLVNEGAIRATGVNQPLIIYPNATFTNAAGATLRAEGAAGLELRHRTFELSGTTLEVQDGSKLTTLSGATLQNGAVQAFGSGQVIADHSTTLKNMTIAAGTTVQQDNSDDVTIGTDGDMTGLTNHGTWRVQSTGHSTYLTFDGNQTLDGAGELVLSDSNRNYLKMASASQTLTHAAGHTIRGSGTLMNNVGNLVNEGAIRATGVNQPLIIYPNATFTNAAGATLRAEGAAGLELRHRTFELSGTTLEVQDGSKLTTLSGATLQNGAVQAFGSGQVIADHSTTLKNMTIAAGTTVQQDNSDDVTIGTDGDMTGLTNHGTWRVQSTGHSTYLTFDGNQTLDGAGELVLSDSNRNYLKMASASQTLTHAAGHTIRGSGTLMNNVGNMWNDGTILAEGTGDLVVDVSSVFTNRAGGVLGGDGKFVFTDGELANHGVIAPGTSPARLNVEGDVDNADTSILDIEIAGLAAGLDADQLVVAGDFEVDGVLRVTFLPGAETLGAGDSIVILSASSLSAPQVNDPVQFDSVVLGWDSAGNFEVTYTGNEVRLSNFSDIQPVPEPLTMVLLGLAGWMHLGRKRRAS